MQVIDIKLLEAVRTSGAGTFLKWENNNDVYLPFEDQLGKTTVGDKYLVVIYRRNNDQRNFASEKIEKYLTDDKADYKEGDEVEVIVYDFSPLGIKVAVEKMYLGLIYQNETFKNLKIGDSFKAYVKKVRDDGKIDLTAQKGGYRNFINNSTDRILKELKDSNGFLPYGDKSPADEIYKKFEMSKKIFKQSIGALYKKKIISISEDGIRLLKS